MAFVRVAIGFLIGISVLPVVVDAVTNLTGTGGALADNPAGALLDVAPILFIAGMLGAIALNTFGKKNG